tara:strand:+ start:1074 stop:1775 length:702 start_codon:yes stop_codon:yes gene_type:complete
MARKRKGLGKMLGSITGSPYDRLMNQIEKVHEETAEQNLSREFDNLALIIRQQYDQERIDAEEHDLLLEEVEEIHPDGNRYEKLEDDSDEFYDEEKMPDAPELEIGDEVNLDRLMRTSSDSFQGSWGSDEYDEYKRKMAEEFYQESDDAITSGDHVNLRSQDPIHRVFRDVDEEVDQVKRAILEEQGVDADAPAAQTGDEPNRVDDDGVEWWQDDEGQWWYRPPDEDDWFPWE